MKSNFVVRKGPGPSATRYPHHYLTYISFVDIKGGASRDHGDQTERKFDEPGETGQGLSLMGLILHLGELCMNWLGAASAGRPASRTKTQIQIWKKPPGSFLTMAADGHTVYPHFLKIILKLGQNSVKLSDDHWAYLCQVPVKPVKHC